MSLILVSLQKTSIIAQYVTYVAFDSFADLLACHASTGADVNSSSTAIARRRFSCGSGAHGTNATR